MKSEKPVRNSLTETALFRPHESRSRDKCSEISKCPGSCELDPPFSHQNQSSQTNMTCLIAKRLACLTGVVMVYTHRVADRRLETRKPKPAWNQVLDGFRAHTSRVIDLICFSKLEVRLNTKIPSVRSLWGKKRSEARKKARKIDRMLARLVLNLQGIAYIYAVDLNWPGLVDILILLRETNDIELSQCVKILLKQKKIIQITKETLTYRQFRIGLLITSRL